MKILITGEGSYIGTSFEKYMVGYKGYEVDTICVKTDKWKEKDFSGYDTVFHVAGIAHSDNGKISEERKVLYYAVNTDLAEAVAIKAKNDGVEQFVFLSSMSIFGESLPMNKSKNIIATTKPNPINAYGNSKLKAEDKLEKIKKEKYKIAIVRPPMVYGYGCKGNYPTLSKFAKKLPIFPLVNNNRSMIYIENLCEFIRLLIVNRESGVFMPQNKEYVSTSDMVKMIAQINNHKLILTRIFNPVLRLFSPIIGVINKVFGNLTYDMSVSKYKTDYYVCGYKESIKRTERGK